MKRLLVILLSVNCYFASGQDLQRSDFVKAVYGNPSPLLENGMTFRFLGINSIFVRSASMTDELYNVARSEGVRVYAEFPTLNGKEYLIGHPGAWPINEKGERAPAADWFMGVCLTDSGFREYRREQLRSLLEKYDVDGVWLDYLHWHAQFETPDPILPETCFCHRCLTVFQEKTSVDVPAGPTAERAQWILLNADSSWRAWRSEVLTDWVRDMKNITRSIRPDTQLGIFYCPWYPEEYNRAHYRTLGLDMKALSDIVDVLSPMLYHHMMGRSVDWVGEYVQWLKTSGLTDGDHPRIWPIVQAHNKPGVVTTEEFRHVMWNGSRAPASGIMMFTIHSLIGDPGKLEVMKDLYRKR